MVRAISLRMNDRVSFFEIRFIIDIDQPSIERFGERWAGRYGVSLSGKFIDIMFDAGSYLPNLIVVDDEGAVVEDATFRHDFFHRSIRFRNAVCLIG